MIKIVSKNLIKESEVEHFLELVREMAAKSTDEKGCISYSLNQSITNPRVYTFIECWEDQAAIDAHNNTEHFKRIVPQFRDLREDYALDKYVEVEL